MATPTAKDIAKRLADLGIKLNQKIVAQKIKEAEDKVKLRPNVSRERVMRSR